MLWAKTARRVTGVFFCRSRLFGQKWIYTTKRWIREIHKVERYRSSIPILGGKPCSKALTELADGLERANFLTTDEYSEIVKHFSRVDGFPQPRDPRAHALFLKLLLEVSLMRPGSFGRGVTYKLDDLIYGDLGLPLPLYDRTGRV